MSPIEPMPTYTPPPRRRTRSEINREHRQKERERLHNESVNQKLLLQIVAARFNAPDGRFARALMRIVNRNLDRRFARLGLK